MTQVHVNFFSSTQRNFFLLIPTRLAVADNFLLSNSVLDLQRVFEGAVQLLDPNNERTVISAIQ